MNKIEEMKKQIDLLIADRNRLINELARRWPSSQRIDAIGQNGNDGLHYPKYEVAGYLVNGHFLRTPQSVDGLRELLKTSARPDPEIITLYAKTNA